MKRCFWVLAVLLAARGTARALPGEVRVGSLGARGVVFRDEAPGIITEHLSAAGDADGDGLADLILIRWDASRDLEGQVHLVFGAPDLPPAPDLARLEAISSIFTRSRPRFRRSDLLWGSAPLGDVDRDGFDDFLVFRRSGAPEGWSEPDITPGVVYVVHGSPAFPPRVDLDAPPAGIRIRKLTSSHPEGASLGLAAATGGDLDGDGNPEFALASSSRRVYVFLGGVPPGDLVDVEEVGERWPGFIVSGTVEGEFLGSSLAFAGDVDGDGLGDLLVGAPNTIGRFSGSVYVIPGAPDFPRLVIAGETGYRFEGRGALAHAGRALAAPGDLNGDGLADFIAGSPGASNQTGEVYVVYGRRDFPPSSVLPDLAGEGWGVTLRGQSRSSGGPGPADARAGETLAVLDEDGDGKPEVLIGSPEFEHRGIDDVGRAYLVSDIEALEGEVLLAGIETGSVPGGIFTSEVRERLASRAAAVGDTNGDGFPDLLLSADPTAAGWDGVASAYLVYGTGGSPGPLAISGLSPAAAPLAGGIEVLITGAGFDEGTSAAVAGVSVPVKRLETSARIVIDAPPSAVLGPADVSVSRGADTATLPGGLIYVPRFYPDIDAAELGASGRGAAIRGARAPFILADVDADGFADLIASSRQGFGLHVVYGGAQLAAEIALPDPEAGPVALEGASFLRGGGLEVAPARVGDVNGDGREDLVAVSQGLIQVLFGGERFDEDEYIEERIAQGMGAAVLHSGARAASVSGGADFDDDGIGDLAVGLLEDFGETGLVRILPGRAEWPATLFLEDVPAWSSDGANDRFGHQVSLLGDVNGDGRGEALAGAPGNGAADGHGYVIFGTPDPRDETTGALLTRGDAVRVDAFKRRDSLGTEVCSPGDFDGDGIADLAISAEGGGIDYAGESYVVLGGPAFDGRPPGTPLDLGDLGDRSVRILGEQAGDGAYHIAPAGDFDGDGRPDLLVGANAPEGEPRAHVVFGRPAGTVSLGALSGGGVRIVGPFRPALHVAGAGDVNGDGFSDAAVGGYALPGGETTVFLVFGQGAEVAFIRGDTNGDRRLDISDPVALLGHLFLGGELRCVDAGDGNDDGALDITDAIFVLNHLFLGAPGPPPPFPERGRDPTEDPLGCELAS